METERNWNGDGGHQNATARKIKDKAAIKARDAKEQMRSLADAGREEVANQLDGVARAFSSAGQNLRDEDQAQVGHYTEIIGEQARNVSQYFREHDADDLIYETESFARRQPLLFLGGCLVAGFAVGRFLHASPPTPRLESGSGERRGYGEGQAIMQRPQSQPVTTAPVQSVGQPIGRPVGEPVARPVGGTQSTPWSPSGTPSGGTPGNGGR